MPPKKRKRILIAEDEPAYARALAVKFQHSGYDANAVSDGEMALAELKDVPYDLLMLDIVMPKRNGFEVLEELKRRGSGILVIVLSNLSQAEDERRARELGAVDFLGKANVTLADVVRRVDALLG